MRVGAAVGLLLTAVMLAGCVDKAKEGGLPPPLPSPSASPSAPSSKPTGTDVQQIIALTRDYYAEATKAANTGETRRLRSLATPDCRCQAVATNLEKVWRTGSVKAPNYYMLSEVSFPRVTSATTGVSNAVYTVAASTYFDKSGRVTQTFPPERRTQVDTVDFLKVRGIWKVADIETNT